MIPPEIEETLNGRDELRTIPPTRDEEELIQYTRMHNEAIKDITKSFSARTNGLDDLSRKEFSTKRHIDQLTSAEFQKKVSKLRL